MLLDSRPEGIFAGMFDRLAVDSQAGTVDDCSDVGRRDAFRLEGCQHGIDTVGVDRREQRPLTGGNPGVDSEEVTGRTDARLDLIETGSGETMIYDRDNPDAWVQSDYVIDVGT